MRSKRTDSRAELARHAPGEALIDKEIEKVPVAFAQIVSALLREIDAAFVAPGVGADAWSARFAAVDGGVGTRRGRGGRCRCEAYCQREGRDRREEMSHRVVLPFDPDIDTELLLPGFDLNASIGCVRTSIRLLLSPPAACNRAPAPRCMTARCVSLKRVTVQGWGGSNAPPDGAISLKSRASYRDTRPATH
jgi:hypothetical protein